MPDTEAPRKDEASVDETEVDAVSFRRNLGDYLGKASYGHDRVVVTKNGREAAALIGPRDLQRLRALDKPTAPASAAA